MARKDYIVGSGNVFEDLGHARPAEALAKAELARKITELITKRRGGDRHLDHHRQLHGCGRKDGSPAQSSRLQG